MSLHHRAHHQFDLPQVGPSYSFPDRSAIAEYPYNNHPALTAPLFFQAPLRKVSLNGIEIRPGERSICSFPTLPLLSTPDTLPLLQSTAVITELRVHEHIYFLLPFHKHFKDLEVLALSYSHANFITAPAIFSAGLFHNAVRDVCARWPGAPPLREFHLEFGESDAADSRHFMWDLQLQREILTSILSTTFPHLTRATFARFVTWQRCVEWRPFVPHQFRGFVKDRLARGTPFTDVGGCLGALDFKY
ncbi:hypothetical protein B0H17DRAFT_2649 [Mycena rosella]|uniref:Uncharacterized protein n=1 Tax=Mycena rosella TaxID=1033263 RepID=A0AAD7MCW8_MYCRO|nr:hypothetical protein B0H17DRAFT_2649 [Mycena rosella]